MQQVNTQHYASDCQVSLSEIINAGTGAQLVYENKIGKLLLITPFSLHPIAICNSHH